MVAAAGVLVGVAFTYLEIRNLARTRQTDLVLRLCSAFGSEELQRAGLTAVHIDFEDYEDFVKKYGPPNSDKPVPLAIVKACLFFEGIGILLHRKLVDIDMVSSVFGYSVRALWEKIEPMMTEARQRFNEPTMWEWSEYLYNELLKREQRLQQTQ